MQIEGSNSEGTEQSNSGLVPSPHADIEVPQDPEIETLIALLSRPTEALTRDEYLDSIAKRQEAVEQHLLRGGVETLRRFFERIRQMEDRQPVRMDLSMLEFSGRLLSG